MSTLDVLHEESPSITIKSEFGGNRVIVEAGTSEESEFAELVGVSGVSAIRNLASDGKLFRESVYETPNLASTAEFKGVDIAYVTKNETIRPIDYVYYIEVGDRIVYFEKVEVIEHSTSQKHFAMEPGFYFKSEIRDKVGAKWLYGESDKLQPDTLNFLKQLKDLFSSIEGEMWMYPTDSRRLTLYKRALGKNKNVHFLKLNPNRTPKEKTVEYMKGRGYCIEV